MAVRRPLLIIRAFQSLRKGGIRTFRQKFFTWLGGKLLSFASFVYSTREVTEIELNLDKFEPHFSKRSEMVGERVSEKELARRGAELPEGWASLLIDFQKKGYLLFWIVAEGSVAGFVCFAFGDYYVQDMNLQLHLKKEEVLLYGIFVEAASRGKVVSGILPEKAAHYLKERDCRRIVAHIDLRNIPSLRYARSHCYVEVKRWKVRKLFGMV